MSESSVSRILDHREWRDERPVGLAIASVAFQLAAVWFGVMSVLIAIFGPGAWFFGTTLGNAMPFPPVTGRAPVAWTALATFVGALMLGALGWALGRGQQWALLLGVVALGVGVTVSFFGLPRTLALLILELAALAYFMRPRVWRWSARPTRA